MAERLIIGLDSSTHRPRQLHGRRRVRLWRKGALISLCRRRRWIIVKQDPNDWWDAAVTAMKQLAQQIDVSLVDGWLSQTSAKQLAFLMLT